MSQNRDRPREGLPNVEPSFDPSDRYSLIACRFAGDFAGIESEFYIGLDCKMKATTCSPIGEPVEFLAGIGYSHMKSLEREAHMTNARTFVAVFCVFLAFAGHQYVYSAQSDLRLPPPRFKGKLSVEQAIKARKSARFFKSGSLSLAQVSQLLWAANGVLPADAISGATRKVTPSAGGLYPLEVYLLTGEKSVKGLPAGVFQYLYRSNSLKTVIPEDRRTKLAAASYSQMWMAKAPVLVVITGVFARTTGKYGNRGINYVFIEAGNADQNLCLQAEALGLRSATVGAFVDSQVSKVLKLPTHTSPLLIVAIGL